MKAKRYPIKSILLIILSLLFIFVLYVLNYYNLLPKKTYSNRHFGIETIHSSIDFNNNEVDDYTDILLGARKDAKNRPKYNGIYQDNGFPPDNIGVCTDVVWRAFKNAGYNLREMVDLDIKLREKAYSHIERPDKNIDFRRVKNLHIFFKEHAMCLATDITNLKEWQPGDIVIFNNDKHIGIISDKRNRHGLPYVIHNGGQPNREEDYLEKGFINGHYRFDSSKILKELLIEWN